MSEVMFLSMPQFDGIEPDTARAIYSAGVIVELGKDEVIIREGETNRALYIVLDGQLQVTLPDTPERFSEVTLASRNPGECVGEYSFLDPHPSSATVTTNAPTRLFKISHESFAELLESNPNAARVIYRNLLVALVRRLRQSDAEADLLPRVG